MRRLSVLLVLALLSAAAAAAEDLSARLAPAVAYNDSEVTVTVSIGEVEEAVTGLTLRVPEGFSVEGPYRGGIRTTIVNGVRRSWTEYRFAVHPPRDAAGRFKVGPVLVRRASGRVTELPVGTLRLGRRPPRGVRFLVQAVPPSGPVGMPFVARYRILYSGRPDENPDVFGEARSPLGLTGLSLPLLARTDLKIEPVALPRDRLARSIRVSDRLALDFERGFQEVDGAIYRALEFSVRVTPLAPGEIDLSGEVGMALVSGTVKQRDFFGRVVEVPRTREYRAATGPAAYRTEELPEEGRPPDFTGAVGRFRIEADARPREVNAFDPVEVTVTVSGEGPLERVALPRWSKNPALARDFEVDADVDPGRIAGGKKVFRVIFRPRSAKVTALPPLPFSFYDPWARRYETVTSKPVPLTVHDVKTVRPEEAVGKAAPESPRRAPREAPVALPGIPANYARPDARPARLSRSPGLFSGAFPAVVLGPLVLFLAAWWWDARRSRPRRVPRKSPLSRALATLARAGTPDEAAEAVTAYVRARLELPPGALTAREIRRALEARLAPPEVVERVERAQEELEAARFAGAAAVPEGWDALLREVDGCLG